MKLKIDYACNSLALKSASFKDLSLKSLTVYPTIICTTALLLSGCQSIGQDASNTFPANNQLLNQPEHPSVSYNSKALFLSSLNTHLQQEHTAVSQIQYRLAPYITRDDIEYDDSSFAKTVLEIKNYQEYKEYEEEDDEYSEYNEYNSKWGLNRFNPFDIDLNTLLEDYKELKQQNVEDDENNYFGLSQLLDPLSFFDMVKQTPEQTEAYNYYGAEPLTITTVSRYQPQQQRYQALYNLDYNATTFQTKMQLPLELDFKQSLVSFDAVLAVPLVTRLSNDNIPLAEDIDGKTVTFDVSDMTQVFPIAQVQQSLLGATQQALTSLSDEHFTEINLKDDVYAKHIGAARGVKIYLGSKQHGELAGRIIKIFTQDMQNYVRANPQDFPDDHIVTDLLNDLALYNKGYQSKDMGSVFQIIEAVLPINWDSFNYFYYDASGNLIGKQNRSEVESYLFGAKYNIVQQTRYDKQSFSASPLASKLLNTFDTQRNTIDGNAWMKEIKLKDAYEDTARYTRYEYDTPYDDDESDYDYLNEVNAAVAEAEAIAALEEAWAIENDSGDSTVAVEEAQLLDEDNLGIDNDASFDSDLLYEDESTETLHINISKRIVRPVSELE